MRVTSATYYKDYAQAVQDLHSKLNKTMQQVSTERKYETAKENPLAYYSGKKIDNQYNNIEAQNDVISDMSNRLYQQEQGAQSIQTEMRTIQTRLLQLSNDSSSGELATVKTFNTDFAQRLQTIANDMNASYENFYVFGGNDTTTVPFELNTELASGKDNSVTLSFSHKFPGQDTATVVDMQYSLDSLDSSGSLQLKYRVNGRVPSNENGVIKYSDVRQTDFAAANSEAMTALLSSMEEEGRMNLGYGSISNRDTLPDTFTNGLNMLTGLNASGLKAMDPGKTINDASGAKSAIHKELLRDPVALTAKAILSTQQYIDVSEVEKGESSLTADQLIKSDVAGSKELLHQNLSDVINGWDPAEQRLSDTYRELGLKESILKATQSRLDSMEDTLTSNYTDKLGIDTYDAIVKMYSLQYSYTAAMKVGSNVMQSSLFDYVR
jgi:flagellar hook-associated protein 3 FlgL